MNRFIKMTLTLSAAAILSACGSLSNQAPAEDINLAGTSWMLPVPKDSDCATNPMLEFSADSVAGDLGCNRAHGSYKIEGNRLTFGPVAVTRRMCAPNYMKLERTMLDAINNVKTISKTESELTFYDADGKVLVTLVPELSGSCN